ncbi:MAG: SUMF1/EgtB/PvdO family nonheme iron enzyme [Anaerolineae bacterium]|nr:SUMF1/EgtB/PvdO family nonheme iron enzyme [Anaerolineae bacterium]
MKSLALIPIALLLMLLPACGPATTGAAALPSMTPEINTPTWQRIPAGEYVAGQFDHEATIAYDYEIMITPVTNAEYAGYLNAALAAGTVTATEESVVGPYPGDPFHGHEHEEEIRAGDWLLLPIGDPASRLIYDGTTFTIMEGYAQHPITMVSWFGAWRYCRAQGGRLPTDSEWEKAARGTDNRPFPWGDEIEGAHANYSKSGDPFGATSGTTPVGFYNGATYDGYHTRDGASPYGIYDMAGNVWEWTGDVHEGTHNRSLRGGSYTNYGYDLRIWSHNNATPIHVAPNVGFRCARDSQGTAP